MVWKAAEKMSSKDLKTAQMLTTSDEVLEPRRTIERDQISH